MTRKYFMFPGFKRMAVTLSYDDAVKQDKRLISIMQQHGLKGTFNVNSGLLSGNGNHMTADEAYALYTGSGMEVAVHGYKHLHLANVDSAIATYDVINDRVELERLFDTVVKGLAYAYGNYSDDVVDILKKCGIEYARTVTSTEKFDIPSDWLRMPATCHHNNPHLMELAQRFVEGNGQSKHWINTPRLFYLWGHSYEFDNDNNWDVIEKFADYIGSRDDIWYATNGEIYEYVTAFDRLRFSSEGTIVHNPSAVTVYIECSGNRFAIAPGETVRIAE
jgi:peptidoglycan/xylan/chitin deacetylase (PgdA/CDA1 family)